jgi:hypothetical protein
MSSQSATDFQTSSIRKISILKGNKTTIEENNSVQNDIPQHTTEHETEYAIVPQSRVGTKWSEEEEQLLVSELLEKTPLSIIAQRHQRKLGGIKNKINNLAIKEAKKQNIKIEEVCNLWNVEVEEAKYAQERKDQNRRKVDEKRQKSVIRYTEGSTNENMDFIQTKLSLVYRHMESIDRLLKDIENHRAKRT